jgi:hypothetical protein
MITSTRTGEHARFGTITTTETFPHQRIGEGEILRLWHETVSGTWHYSVTDGVVGECLGGFPDIDAAHRAATIALLPAWRAR